MILLTATTEILRLITSSIADIDYLISYADITTSAFSPSSTQGKILTATTTTILAAPIASTQRQVKLITIINRHASTTNTVRLLKDISATQYFLTPVVTLLAGESMQYVDSQGWIYYATNGAAKSGNPGATGLDKEIQFNNGGIALGSDSDLIWDKTINRLGIGITSNSGTIALAGDTTDETASPANQVLVYSKSIAGRMMPKWIGPSGVDTPFQASIGFNGVRQVTPGTGTTAATAMTVFGTAFTSTGTQSQIAITAGTSVKNKMRMVGMATSTTAGNVVGNITPNYEAKIDGGFFFSIRFGVGGTIVSGQRQFHGLWSNITLATNNDPTTSTTAKVGIGYALTGTVGNWEICMASGTAAMTAVDLGSTNFLVNNTGVYELVLFCPPAGNIGYRVTNLENAFTQSGTLTTNPPTSSTVLAVQNWITNNATGAAATMLINKWYLESDY